MDDMDESEDQDPLVDSSDLFACIYHVNENCCSDEHDLSEMAIFSPRGNKLLTFSSSLGILFCMSFS